MSVATKVELATHFLCDKVGAEYGLELLVGVGKGVEVKFNAYAFLSATAKRFCVNFAIDTGEKVNVMYIDMILDKVASDMRKTYLMPRQILI